MKPVLNVLRLRRDARRDAEQGMGTDRVDAALRKAGIDPDDAEYSPAESSDIH